MGTAVRNATVEDLKEAVDEVLGLLLFILHYAPLLFCPLRLGWRWLRALVGVAAYAIMSLSMRQFVQEELDQVRRIVLSGLNGHRARVCLFGSRARGNAMRWSDVDVAALRREAGREAIAWTALAAFSGTLRV
jgi:predicted nucleotidyltransferase